MGKNAKDVVLGEKDSTYCNKYQRKNFPLGVAQIKKIPS